MPKTIYKITTLNNVYYYDAVERLLDIPGERGCVLAITLGDINEVNKEDGITFFIPKMRNPDDCRYLHTSNVVAFERVTEEQMQRLSELEEKVKNNQTVVEDMLGRFGIR